jgi:carboxylesterase
MNASAKIDYEAAAPKRPPVLLLHGLTGAPADLQVITKYLQRSGLEVSAPMLPGHGLDEKGLLKTGWRDWLAAAETQLLALTADGGQAFVGGLSMGAVLALALAARHPGRIRGVICFAPTLRYDGWVVPKNAWLIPLGARIPLVNRYRFQERPPYGIKDERLRAKMVEMLFSGALGDAGLPFMPGRSLAQNLSLIRRVKKQLHTIHTPMLIVHSTEDDITHVRNAQKLARSVRGTVDTLYLTDSYHLVTVDRERNKVAQATLSFIENQCASPASDRPAPPAARAEPARRLAFA